MRLKITVLFLFLAFIISFSYVDDRIELNTAKYRDLLLLPDIDENLAGAIIEYRNKKGGFENLEELIPIVGNIIYDKIRFDLKVTPSEKLIPDKINGKFEFGLARDSQYLDGKTPFATTLSFKFGDTFEGFIGQEDYEIKSSSSSRPMDKARTNDDVYSDFTYYIFDYEKPEKKEKNVFKEKIFKKITISDQRKQYEDIIKKLEKKYGTRISIKEDNDYVTGYYESNPDSSEYFKHPDIKEKLDVQDETPYIKEEEGTEYNRQNYEKFETDINKKITEKKEQEQEETEKRNLYRKLKYRIDSGFIYIPYVKSSKYGSKGDGWSLESYFDSFNMQLFYLKNNFYSHEDPVYGAKLETELKDSKIGTLIYKLENEKTGNDFDHFMLYGEKDINSKTNIYMEYGTVINKSTSFYVKGFSKYENMNITASLKVVRDNCFDYDDLEPFGQNYYSTVVSGDELNPYFKLDYYLPEGNKVTLEYENSQRNTYSSKYGYSDSYSSSSSLTYRFKASKKVSTEWYFSSKRSARDQSLSSSDNGEIIKATNLSLYTKYKMDKEAELTFKLKRENESDSDKYENTFDVRLYKDFGKNLSTKFATVSVDNPGPEFYRQNEFSFSQKLSDSAELEYTTVRDSHKRSDGSKRDYKYSELVYELRF